MALSHAGSPELRVAAAQGDGFDRKGKRRWSGENAAVAVRVNGDHQQRARNDDARSAVNGDDAVALLTWHQEPSGMRAGRTGLVSLGFVVVAGAVVDSGGQEGPQQEERDEVNAVTWVAAMWIGSGHQRQTREQRRVLGFDEIDGGSGARCGTSSGIDGRRRL